MLKTKVNKKREWMSETVLNSPVFTIRTAKGINDDLTYRKINDWENKHLITPHRISRERGWRMFSIIEMIRLLIICDLKNFGLSNSSIIKILETIFNYDFGQEDATNTFEHLIDLSFQKKQCVIVILSDENVQFFFDEGPSDQKNIFDEIYRQTCIILPFSIYVQRTFSKVQENVIWTTEPLFENFIKYIDEETEQKIVNLIKNADYEEIVITKSNARVSSLKATARQRGNFSGKDILEAIEKADYQNVRLTRVDGQVLSIVREENFKA